MEYLENRTYDELQIGDSASLSRTLTEKDIQVFAIMSGDFNPAHVDEEYAQSEMFHKIIGHGMWGGSLISTVLGTQLPGPGTIYLSQTLRFKKPVAIGDTLQVTVTVTEKKEKNRVMFLCECRNQRDEMVIEGQAEVIAPSKKIRRPKAELPQIALRRQKSLFRTFLDMAKSLPAAKTGAIFPIHQKIIQALADAKQAGFIDPILVGPLDPIQKAAAAANIDIKDWEIIAIDNIHSAILKTIAMAREGLISLMVRGGVTKEELLRLILKHDKGLLTNCCMSYAAVMDVPTYPKPLILTDTLINIDPNLEVKRMITQNAIDFAHALGITDPKVAILAGIDAVSYAMRSTVDAAALCKMAERGQIQGAFLDGPLTFDNVISIEAARERGIESPVIGNADILVVPNVETGNILANQLEYLAEAKNASLALGGRVPVLIGHINDIELSTVSCALALLYNQHRSR